VKAITLLGPESDRFAHARSHEVTEINKLTKALGHAKKA